MTCSNESISACRVGVLALNVLLRSSSGMSPLVSTAFRSCSPGNAMNGDVSMLKSLLLPGELPSREASCGLESRLRFEGLSLMSSSSLTVASSPLAPPGPSALSNCAWMRW